MRMANSGWPKWVLNYVPLMRRKRERSALTWIKGIIEARKHRAISKEYGSSREYRTLAVEK